MSAAKLERAGSAKGVPDGVTLGVATFAPNHAAFVVPEGAKPGDKHKIQLSDGREVEYTLPPGSVAGEEHTVRIDSGLMKKELTVVKQAKDDRLGMMLTDPDDGRHPIVTKMGEGVAVGIVQVGDVLLSVSEGSRVTVEASDTEEWGRLLRSARGTLKLTVLRPVVDAPMRVLHSGFLSKRSPKTVLGMQAWQKRWFELDADKITYWELHAFQQCSYLGSQKGVIALGDVAGVRLSVDPKAQKIVNVLMKSKRAGQKRMYEFAAADAEQATAFAEALRAALVAVLDAGAKPAAGADASEAVDISELSMATTAGGSVEGEVDVDADGLVETEADAPPDAQAADALADTDGGATPQVRARALTAVPASEKAEAY
jgi:hypothetical protein